jgi:hypothetical protein
VLGRALFRLNLRRARLGRACQHRVQRDGQRRNNGFGDAGAATQSENWGNAAGAINLTVNLGSASS